MGDRKPLKKLSAQHLKFCDLYAQFVPPAIAYARAFNGSDAPDPYPGNAARLLREPLIQAELARLMPPELAGGDPIYVAYRRNLVRAELDRVAFFHLPDVLDDAGRLKPLSRLTDDQRAAIAEIIVDDNRLRVKAHSKDAALAALTKLDGLAEPDKISVDLFDLSKLSDEQLVSLRAILATASHGAAVAASG